MVEPPGPIPNPEVKRHSANGSGTIGPVRVGRRQVYAQHFENIQSAGLFFVGIILKCLFGQDPSGMAITNGRAPRV